MIDDRQRRADAAVEGLLDLAGLSPDSEARGRVAAQWARFVARLGEVDRLPLGGAEPAGMLRLAAAPAAKPRKAAKPARPRARKPAHAARRRPPKRTARRKTRRS